MPGNCLEQLLRVTTLSAGRGQGNGALDWEGSGGNIQAGQTGAAGENFLFLSMAVGQGLRDTMCLSYAVLSNR